MNLSHSKIPTTIKIGILVFNNFEPLDVWGFIQAFSIARFLGTDYSSASPTPFAIELISNDSEASSPGGKPQPIKSYNGPYVVPDVFRAEALARNYDVLMIPGGFGVRELLDPNDAHTAALLNWVRHMDKQIPIMSSVCTGAAILASAGVLDGKHAATNHQAFAWVTCFGPNVLWDNVSRWVDAGKYVTSAGVSAGTDMAFHLVARLAGRAVAETAVKASEYDWHRDPEQPIYYPEQAAVPTTGCSGGSQ